MSLAKIIDFKEVKKRKENPFIYENPPYNETAQQKDYYWECLLTARTVKKCQEIIEKEINTFFKEANNLAEGFVIKYFTKQNFLENNQQLVFFLMNTMQGTLEKIANIIEPVINERFKLKTNFKHECSISAADFDILTLKFRSLNKTYQTALITEQILDNIFKKAAGDFSPICKEIYGLLSPHKELLKDLDMEETLVGERCRVEILSSIKGFLENSRLKIISELSKSYAHLIYSLHDDYVEPLFNESPEEEQYSEQDIQTS